MSRYERSEVEKVEWDDVAGLTEAKAALREAIENPIKHADLYRLYGKRPSKGVLLYGPPGCGKTMLGKAAAYALKQMHGALVKRKPVAEGEVTITLNGNPFEAILRDYRSSIAFDSSTPASENDSGFFYVKAPEILDAFVGSSERTVRKLFADARAYKKKHGHPAVLFIDEAEAILSHRRQQSMSATIVPMFLSEMDGFDDAGCFVILATNRPDDLDSAVVREGRIDRKIRIARPDESAAAETFRVHLRGKPSAVDPAWCAAELYSSLRVLYQLTYKSDRSGSVVLGDLMSGAAIATLVDRACEVAIGRDVAAGGEMTGLRREDVAAAIDQMEREYRTANHIDDLIRIVEEAGEPVAAVRKASKDGTFSTVALSNDGPKKHEALN